VAHAGEAGESKVAHAEEDGEHEAAHAGEVGGHAMAHALGLEGGSSQQAKGWRVKALNKPKERRRVGHWGRASGSARPFQDPRVDEERSEPVQQFTDECGHGGREVP
jgi:hypothetical protein